MKELTCENCGKIFKTKAKQRRFCCRECYKHYIKTHKIEFPSKRIKEGINGKKVKCAICGKEEIVYLKRAEHYKCCSKECLNKYNSIKYSQKIKITCENCGKEFEIKKSELNRRRCCSRKCINELHKTTYLGANNPNSYEIRLKNNLISNTNLEYKNWIHQSIVKKYFNIKKIPKGYHVHHKDCVHTNNTLTNLVLLPKETHMLIHRIFGNVLLNALHTNRITREEFFKICNTKECEFYKDIIDLDITHQAVLKQGELLETPEVDNQQPSIFRNIYEGSTTNSRVLTCKDEDGNADKSALHI